MKKILCFVLLFCGASIAASAAQEAAAPNLTGVLIWVFIGAAFLYAVYTLLFEHRR